MNKIKKQRKEIWVETEFGLVPSQEAVEQFMDIFKPSPAEIVTHENELNRRVEEGLLTKGKDGNYYQTEKAISLLKKALQC